MLSTYKLTRMQPLNDFPYIIDSQDDASCQWDRFLAVAPASIFTASLPTPLTACFLSFIKLSLC